MNDRFQRQINYLRISVTDRCNLRCVYCMPPEGVQLIPHHEILTLEEIAAVVAAGVRVGIKKVRLTGGEPLVRRGILDLVAKLRRIPEIDDLALTTNGILLGDMAGALQAAGVNRVNISLDTLQPDRFRRITRGGDLGLVWRGINAALQAGLQPVKINTVAMRDFNDDELARLAGLTLDLPLHVRFIELMPVGSSGSWAGSRFISSAEVRKLITSRLGNLEAVKKVKGSGPARYYRLPGAQGTVGFISPVSDHFCAQCNRLRLTATGQLRPCLLNHREIDVKKALRGGAGRDELVRFFREAVLNKPDGHHLNAGWWERDRNMSQIGG